jgi:hypothetical protein
VGFNLGLGGSRGLDRSLGFHGNLGLDGNLGLSRDLGLNRDLGLSRRGNLGRSFHLGLSRRDNLGRNFHLGLNRSRGPRLSGSELSTALRTELDRPRLQRRLRLQAPLKGLDQAARLVERYAPCHEDRGQPEQ